MTKRNLANVKPVKCWAVLSGGKHLLAVVSPTETMFRSDSPGSEGCASVLLTAAAFTKLKRRLKELEAHTEKWNIVDDNSKPPGRLLGTFASMCAADAVRREWESSGK